MTRSQLLRRSAIGGGLGVAVLLVAGWLALPLPASLANPGPVPRVVLLDRHGLPLRMTRAVEGRGGWTSLGDLDPKLLQAFLAVEDHRFYDHHGVDVRALGRAAWQDVRARALVAGGSTITMQLARLLLGTPRTIPGKVSQIFWSWRFDLHQAKQTIFEQYLNRVPLGQGTAGVTAAADLYFDADPRNLSLGQAALLAALAHAPARDNPLVSREHARARRRLALARMAALGFARPEDVRRANSEPVLVHDAATPFLAPHFTTHVLDEAGQNGVVPSGEWRTTLDLGLQTALEAEVRHTVETLRDKGVAQAALVVLDNSDGDVLAWIGSPDFFADTAGQVDMVISPRQPGSALKPFLYGLAFDRGYTTASVLPDIPHTYETTFGPYRPRNYDRAFHGPVRARDALGSSYNVPAVELAQRLGVASLLSTLHTAGFATLDHSAEYYGLGLALGNGDVTLLELANGYRALANGGVWRPARWNLSTAVPLEQRRIMSRQAAALVLDVLSDPVARMPSFGNETPLDLPFRAAAKTGTSRHFTDNWAVLTTGRFTVAVWVGNFNGTPMQGVGGITGAGPLLHRAALLVAQHVPPGAFATPPEVGAVAIRICRLSGMRAGPECPPATEWFVPGTEPTQTCDWHRGGRVVLPEEYADWAASQSASASGTLGAADPEAETRGSPQAQVTPDQGPGVNTTTPTPVTPVTPGSINPGAMPRGTRESSGFRISSPQDGDHYSVPVGTDPRYATIALRAVGGAGVRWYVDGHPWRSDRWPIAHGRHMIRAVDARGNADQVSIVVE